LYYENKRNIRTIIKLNQAIEGIKEPEASRVMGELLNLIEELAYKMKN
jgi:hypothetical protein